MVRNIANNHGRQIFIYNNIQTNQVLYSLTRSLKNELLKQLPFVGKKSVPPALRKDHWAPLATVFFPNTTIGLKTYHKLREYRKLHETCYDPTITLEKSKKERKYIIMNQKANSIADLAQSLRIEITRSEKLGEALAEGDIMVKWRNIHDAQFAAEWPKLVVHGDQLRSDRPYSAPKVDAEEMKDAAIGSGAAKEEVKDAAIGLGAAKEEVVVI